MNVSELELAQSNFSDLYKDVYGFRPRWQTVEQWTSTEWLNQQIEELIVQEEIEAENKRIYESHKIAEFEALVEQTIAVGAGDRETALRWIFDGEEDDQYVCYLHHLPYNYFRS